MKISFASGISAFVLKVVPNALLLSHSIKETVYQVIHFAEFTTLRDKLVSFARKGTQSMLELLLVPNQSHVSLLTRREYALPAFLDINLTLRLEDALLYLTIARL